MDTRELPERLSITDDYEIQEALSEPGMMRILLHPSKCYLKDEIVQLENVIEAIINRYNQHESLSAYQRYMDYYIVQNKMPQPFEKFKKALSFVG